MSCCWFMICSSERAVGAPVRYSGHHPGTSRSLRAVMLAQRAPDEAGGELWRDRTRQRRTSQRDLLGGDIDHCGFTGGARRQHRFEPHQLDQQIARFAETNLKAIVDVHDET